MIGATIVRILVPYYEGRSDVRPRRQRRPESIPEASPTKISAQPQCLAAWQ